MKTTESVKREYLVGTLLGWLNNNPGENSKLRAAGYPAFNFAGLCERLEKETGKRVTQSSRGVEVWQ
jgi:hypothetical protein